MKKICYIVSAGDCAGINVMKNKEDYIIAVDGGYQYVKESGIIPDMILGDFDSLGFVPKVSNVIVHKPEKDDTDTMLAVQEGIKLGYRDFILFGALGGRWDHTIANLSVLIYLSKRGMSGLIEGNRMKITAITNKEFILPRQDKGVFSVFTFDGSAKGVSIKGAKYELHNTELTNDVPIGVSNEFIDKEIKVSVTDGTLIIMWYVNTEIGVK